MRLDPVEFKALQVLVFLVSLDHRDFPVRTDPQDHPDLKDLLDKLEQVELLVPRFRDVMEFLVFSDPLDLTDLLV